MRLALEGLSGLRLGRDVSGEAPPPPPNYKRSLSDMAPSKLSREMSSLGRALLEDALAGDAFFERGGEGGLVDDGGAAKGAEMSGIDSPSSAGFTKIEIGDMIDVREADTQRWHPATVVNMARDDSSGEAWVKVEHTSGVVVEWVKLGMQRIAQFGKASIPRTQHSFTIGQYVDALDYFTNKFTKEPTSKWRVASVVDVDTSRVLIHWEGWAEKWDCWVDVTLEPNRVKPLGQQTVGGSKEALAEKKLEKEFAERLSRQPEPKEIQEVSKDGNCLFHSLAHQIYGLLDTDAHEALRDECVRYMREHRDHFSMYVDGNFDEYLRSRTRDGVWGDNLEIVAMAEIFDRPVEVWSREAPVPASGVMEVGWLLRYLFS